MPESKSHSELNASQAHAASASLKPLLIVAGAGTGKTLTLTHRLVHLITSGAKPETICGLTFTNKAAKEMRERAARYLPELASGARGPFLGTFHAFGAKILRMEHRLVGRGINFLIYDSDDSLSLIKKTLKALGVPSKTISPSVASHAISHVKNGMHTLEDVAVFARNDMELMKTIYDAYEQALVRTNAFDFDDLIEKAVRMLRAHPERLKAYQNKYHHILVDEYQDVNAMQYELIRLLAGSTSSTPHSVSVVGDDHQMIYSWRGSNLNTFLHFDTHWPEAQTVILDQNYRSTGMILAAASAVIAQNERQKPKTLWTENEEGELIRLTEARNENEEAEWIAWEIHTMTHNDNNDIKKMAPSNNDPAIIGHRHDQGYVPTTAVLYRTNAQSRAIEQALIVRNIPYHIFGGVRFYDRREVKDALAFLKYAWNPQDELSRERLQKNLLKSRFLALEDARNTISESTTPEKALAEFIRATSYFEYLVAHFPNAEERKENIFSLMRFAREFDSLGTFLERASLLEAHEEPQRATGNASVILSSIHLAKGLEFTRVFLAGCSEGLLPHARSFEERAGLEEERRLMYVAMTRARKWLALSFYDLPSRFISEIPQELFVFKSLASSTRVFSDDEERYITLD